MQIEIPKEISFMNLVMFASSQGCTLDCKGPIIKMIPVNNQQQDNIDAAIKRTLAANVVA